MGDGNDPRITPKMRRHILDGEPNGSGGHRYGTNRPNRTEFPEAWSDARAISAVSYTLDNHYFKDAKRPNVVKLYGFTDGVRIYVRFDGKGSIETAHPLDGVGVVRNDKRDGTKKEYLLLGSVKNVPLPP